MIGGRTSAVLGTRILEKVDEIFSRAARILLLPSGRASSQPESHDYRAHFIGKLVAELIVESPSAKSMAILNRG
jgi:hypothetical protein